MVPIFSCSGHCKPRTWRDDGHACSWLCGVKSISGWRGQWRNSRRQEW